MSNPRFTHDCDKCEFVWSVGDMDWYVHDRTKVRYSIHGQDPLFTDIIGRFGSDGPDYYSTWVSNFSEVPQSEEGAMALATFIRWRRERFEGTTQEWCDIVNKGDLFYARQRIGEMNNGQS